VSGTVSVLAQSAFRKRRAGLEIYFPAWKNSKKNLKTTKKKKNGGQATHPLLYLFA
jgi:hypothetical protein